VRKRTGPKTIEGFRFEPPIGLTENKCEKGRNVDIQGLLQSRVNDSVSEYRYRQEKLAPTFNLVSTQVNRSDK